MQRLLCALVAAMALAVTAGAGTALAGGGLPVLGGGGPPSQSGQSGQSNRQDESVSNSNYQDADQSNATLNVPINVAALNSGGVDQSNGGVDESNGNANATSQAVSAGRRAGPPLHIRTGPGRLLPGSASLRHLAGERTAGRRPAAGTVERPVPVGVEYEPAVPSRRATWSSTCRSMPRSPTVAAATASRIAGCQGAWNSGSKDGPQSGVDQSNGGVQESNGNLNATSQVVSQDESSSQQSSGGAAGGGYGKDSFDKGPSDTSGQSSDQHENVSNHNVQQADQHNAVVNVPINVAALNTGGVDQRNGGVDESNGNFNATGQYVWQDESSTQSSSSGHSYGKDDCRCSGSDDRAEGATPSQQSTQHESVSNSNHQSADQSNLTGNVPVNAALLNGGGSGCKCDVGKGDGGKGGVDQRNGGVDESNGNFNATGQYVWQDESSTQSSSSGHSYGKDDCRCSGGDDRAEGATPSQHSTQHESVSNSNHQSADQSNLTGNVPVNAALLNSGSYGGKQTFGKDGRQPAERRR